MPTLALTKTGWSPSTIGGASASSSRCGDLDRPALARQAFAEHGELVAAQARERVAGGEQRREPLGELGQQLVAALVAVAVVDDLEAVEVEPEHRGGAAVAGGQRERVVDAVDEQRAVRQPGERVVQRAMRAPPARGRPPAAARRRARRCRA